MRAALLLLASLSAFAAGRELAPRPTGPTAYHTSGVQTAFAGDRFLTIWYESRGELGAPIVGILHDASGRRVSAHSFAILPSAGSARLVAADESFALFESDGSRMVLTGVDLEGRVLRTTTLDLPEPYVPSHAAWNGSRFLLVHGTTVSLLTRDGAVVHTDMPFDGIVLAVAGSRGGFALVTSGEDGLCTRRISNAGTREWTGCVAFGSGSPHALSVIAAPLPDGGALMVWTGAAGELRGAAIRAGGTAGPVRVIATHEHPLRAVHLARAGDRYVLLFTRDSWTRFVRSLVLDGDGVLLEAPQEVAPDRYSDVAAATSGQATLAVFEEPRFPWKPQSVVVARDGSVVRGPETATIAKARQTQPALADAGSHILAAWSDTFAADALLATSALTHGGEPLFRGTVAHGQLASRELPSNGSEVLLLSHHDVAYRQRKVQATFVNPGGAPLAGTIFLGDTAADWSPTAAATWIDDRWLVAWASPGWPGVTVAVLRDHRVALKRTHEVRTPLPQRHYRMLTHLALARNTSTTLLVWTEELRPSCSTLPPCGPSLHRTYAARLTPDGDFIDATPLALPSGEHSLSVATSGEEFMVLAEATATVIDASGRRVLRSTDVFGWKAAGDVAWNGSAYVVALRYQLARWYLSHTLLDRRGNILGATRGIETLPAENLEPPSIAGPVIALQEGDWTTGARAVVYDESQLAPLPPPPPHPVPRFVLEEDGWFEITWDPVPGAELYVVTPLGDLGWWNRVQVVTLEWPLRTYAATSSVRVTAVGPGGTSLPPPRRRSVNGG